MRPPEPAASGPFTSSALAPALALAALLLPLPAQSLAYDGFGNGPRPDLDASTGGAGWTTAWANGGTDPTEVGGVGLSFPGLATTPGAAITPKTNGVWPSTSYARSFPVPGGAAAIFVSFLLRSDTIGGDWGGLQFGQYPYAMTVGAPLGAYQFGLMTSQGLGDYSNHALTVGQTVLLVVAIRRNTPSAGLTYRLYVDPAVGQPEPANADATFGMVMLNALPGALTLTNSTGFTTDELRVGTTWASVLPQPISPWTDLGFAKPGITGAPHLAGTGPMAAQSWSGVALANARPTSTALLVIGTQIVNQPLLGGILVPDPAVVVVQPTDASGAATYQNLLPAGLAAGLFLRFQYWIVDAAALQGFSASNGLQGVTQ